MHINGCTCVLASYIICDVDFIIKIIINPYCVAYYIIIVCNIIIMDGGGGGICPSSYILLSLADSMTVLSV